MPASTACLNLRKAVGSKAFLVPVKGYRRPPVKRTSKITLRTLDGRLMENLDELEASKVTYTNAPAPEQVAQKNRKVRKKLEDAPVLSQGSGLKPVKFGYI